jgi:hypothetical protein
VNGYKRQPFTAHRAVDPPRSCVSRLPRRHRGLEIVAALHNRERSNNEPQESHTTHRSQWWPRRRFATEFRDSRISSIPRRGHRYSVRPPSRRRLGPVPIPLGLPSVSKLWPRCGHIRDRWARVSRAVGPAAEAPRSRVGVGCLSIVRSVATRAGRGQRTSRTLPGVCNFDCQTTRSDHHADERTQEGPRRASRAA